MVLSEGDFLLYTNHYGDQLALCRLLGESLQLPIYYIDTAGQNAEQQAFGKAGEETNPWFASAFEQISSLLARHVQAELPTLLASPFMEQFMVIPVIEHKEAAHHASSSKSKPAASLVIGPCSSEKLSAEIISNLLNDHRISHKARAKWQAYLQSLPYVPLTRFLHLGVLAHKLINGELLQITDVLHSNLTYSVKQQLQENVDMTVAMQRDASFFHMQLSSERQFFELVRSGKKDELLKWMLDLPYEEVGVLSKRSQLRNRKNLAIISIALGTRAAIEGGLYEELAFTLSDLHIQHIEELNELKAVEAAMIAALLDFAERVAKGSKQGISKPVMQCQQYIYNHLYEPVTPDMLAKLTGLHAGYVSQLFKKEAGIPLASYIQREKVEEAKRLLLHTRDKIATISTKLCFYDETYFVKVFKKHTGMTPRAFRISGGKA